MVNPSAEQVKSYIADLKEKVRRRDPNEPEFHQALDEILDSLEPVLPSMDIAYLHVLERFSEPEGVHTFRVAWVDDSGVEQVNRGWRIVMSTSCGPGKGGLRFRSDVNLGVLKFLALEQTLKNALTTLPLGAAKGGSDFDPKGKSDREVMSFCQSFMTALYRSIGPDIDVPAGDINVGARELGYLFGQYKRITRRFNGTLTGKGPTYGGSLMRPEATGYGTVYYLNHALEAQGRKITEMRHFVSGSGNVAQYAAEKLIELGANVASLSDSKGTVFFGENGLDRETHAKIMNLKNVKRGRLSELDLPAGAEYVEGVKPWSRVAKGDVAIPCATQNEIADQDGEILAKAGCLAIAEGANMPTTAKATAAVLASGAFVCPAKAANAGGVAVSGLEMGQNAGHISWSRERVGDELKSIMKRIFEETSAAAESVGMKGNYIAGANIAGFKKVATAMIAQGTL